MFFFFIAAIGFTVFYAAAVLPHGSQTMAPVIGTIGLMVAAIAGLVGVVVMLA